MRRYAYRSVYYDDEDEDDGDGDGGDDDGDGMYASTSPKSPRTQ